MGAPSVADLLRAGTQALHKAGIAGPERDARLLLAHAMGIGADRLTLHLQDAAGESAIHLFPVHLEARIGGRPVSRIIGRRMFFGRWYRVTNDVLDPRPETETLVEQALAGPMRHVLDLGTGSGCLLITLLAERPKAQGLGSDLSQAALNAAADNARALGVSDRAQFRLSDWWQDIPDRFDLIVSNPPYIAASEMPHLAREVRDHDPEMALTDGADGLVAYRAIAAGALSHLTPGGRLLVEIGPTQGAAVAGLLKAAGLHDISLSADMDGRDRVVGARR